MPSAPLKDFCDRGKISPMGTQKFREIIGSVDLLETSNNMVSATYSTW